MRGSLLTTTLGVLLAFGPKGLSDDAVQVPVGKENKVEYDGTEIVLRDEFEFPPRELPWLHNERNAKEISPGETAKMIPHLVLKKGATLHRLLLTAPFVFVGQIGDKRYPLTESLAGFVFENVETPEQAEELVSLVQRGKVIRSNDAYKRFVEGCNAVDKGWVRVPDAPFVGLKAERWATRTDLFLVRALVREETIVVALDYLVDKQGHITKAKSVTCIQGPLVMPGSGSVSRQYLDFMAVAKRCELTP